MKEAKQNHDPEYLLRAKAMLGLLERRETVNPQRTSETGHTDPRTRPIDQAEALSAVEEWFERNLPSRLDRLHGPGAVYKQLKTGVMAVEVDGPRTDDPHTVCVVGRDDAGRPAITHLHSGGRLRDMRLPWASSLLEVQEDTGLWTGKTYLAALSPTGSLAWRTLVIPGHVKSVAKRDDVLTVDWRIPRTGEYVDLYSAETGELISSTFARRGQSGESLSTATPLASHGERACLPRDAEVEDLYREVWLRPRVQYLARAPIDFERLPREQQLEWLLNAEKIPFPGNDMSILGLNGGLRVGDNILLEVIERNGWGSWQKSEIRLMTPDGGKTLWGAEGSIVARLKNDEVLVREPGRCSSHKPHDGHISFWILSPDGSRRPLLTLTGRGDDFFTDEQLVVDFEDPTLRRCLQHAQLPSPIKVRFE